MNLTKLGLSLLLLTVFAGCGPNSNQAIPVIVIDFNSAPVAGAEVFQDGQLKGTTNANGQILLSAPQASGTKLFARRLMYTQPAYRPSAPASWVAHFYQTSMAVNLDGSVTDHTVTNPAIAQTLVLSPNNALIGWHLTVSLDWDASEDEFNQLEARFNAASQYLYNLTDGQFFIEEVDLADDNQLHIAAEIAFKVDTFARPHSTYNGGFLAAVGGLPHIYMAPFATKGFSGNEYGSDDPRTVIHELGHLALGLADEYQGFHIKAGGNPYYEENYCTEIRNYDTGGPEFITNGAKSACAMDTQFQSNKLCSAHIQSFHELNNLQPGPCWNTINSAYRDPGRSDRWIVRTHDMRGAVVGTLPGLPVGLRPNIKRNNKKYSDLCKPVVLLDPHGAAASQGTVWVRPLKWRTFDYTVGRLTPAGLLEVRGLHQGDKVQSPFSMLPFTCTITN